MLLKEPNTKPVHYPLGVVREVQVIDLNEVIGALIFTGKTLQTVKRNMSSLFTLLQAGELDGLNGEGRVVVGFQYLAGLIAGLLLRRAMGELEIF